MGSLLVTLVVLCGLGVTGCPHPPDRSQHGCTVGIDRDPPVLTPPPRQGGGGTRAPVLTYVSAFAGAVVHVVVLDRGGFVV